MTTNKLFVSLHDHLTKTSICLFYGDDGYQLITFENGKTEKKEKIIDEYDFYEKISYKIHGNYDKKSEKLKERFIKKIKQMKKARELCKRLGKEGQEMFDKLLKLKQK